MVEIVGVEVEEHYDRYELKVYQVPAEVWETLKTVSPAQAAQFLKEKYQPALSEPHASTEPTFVVKERVIPGPQAV